MPGGVPEASGKSTATSEEGRQRPRRAGHAGGSGGSSPRASTRIAMWSGPRTLSTALMRSFGNRRDTVVIDEPLYGYYLAATGISHPGRDEIVASMPTDWADVVRQLAYGELPPGKTVYYQKHMAHHLLAEVDRQALASLRHAFLIRDPRRLLASYAKVRDTPTLADLGLAQQVEIFRRFGGPVIDAADIAASPRPALEALCAALAIPFDEAMLSWPPGPRPDDGVWARHWYANVWASTAFAERPSAERHSPDRHSQGDRPEPAGLPPELEPLAAQCQPFYDELAAHRLIVGGAAGLASHQEDKGRQPCRTAP